MKLLFTDTDRGYSWSHNKRYYLCDSIEEYEELCKKYANHENYVHDANLNADYPKYEQVFLNTDICCTPHTVVSDGFAIRGGHNLRAKGIEVKHNNNGPSTNYSSYDYYIKPDSITENSVAEEEFWWV